MDNIELIELIERIVYRVCGVADIQVIETKHGGSGEDAETYTDKAQGIFNILLDEIEDFVK